MFSFLLSTCNRNTTFSKNTTVCVPYVKPVFQQVVIEQTRFLSTVFLCSELKLYNIYSGVNFCGKMFAVIFICGNLFLRIAEKNRKNQNPQRFRVTRYQVSALLNEKLKTLVKGSLNSGTLPVPFWCIFAQSVVIRKNIYTATYDGLLFFRKREVREGKKRTKSLVRWGSQGQNTSLDSATCFGFWEVFLDSGKCFGFWEVFLDSGKCFVLMSHGTFTTLLLSNHSPFKRFKLSGGDIQKMCYQ